MLIQMDLLISLIGWKQQLIEVFYKYNLETHINYIKDVVFKFKIHTDDLL